MFRTLFPARARLACALAVLLLPAAGLAAQEHVVIRPEPGTPVVAMEVLVAAGPADEPEGQAGVAHLTARSATAPILPILDSLGARLSVQGHKDALSFTLIAAPDVWRETSRLLLVALFRDPADSAAVERERRAVRAELRAREMNPADAAAKETDAAVFGPDHPWGRPAVGTSETVARLTLADVDAFIRARLVPERTAVAVVGPVDAEGAREHLRAFFREPLGGESALPEPTPAESPVKRDYNSITTWVTASYPFPEEVDPEALRLVAALATEQLSFSPTRRSVYNARAEVLRRREGGELRLQVVVPPAEAERWAERMHAVVSGFAEAPLPAGLFAERVRRYRGERLRELSSPEARARAAAREVLLGRRGTGRVVELEGLTPERLHRAAGALGTPVVVFLGPLLESGEAGR